MTDPSPDNLTGWERASREYHPVPPSETALQQEVDRLAAENTRLRRIATAARVVVNGTLSGTFDQAWAELLAALAAEGGGR